LDHLLISQMESIDDRFEVVERKGLGHPDTICDALADTLSRALCREYQRRFGEILHHNVDKALLSGGSAAPAYNGGTVIAPINIYLAGRAISEVGSDILPITDIAVETSRAWFKANLHALDAERHVHIHPLIKAGSQDLQSLFARRKPHEAPLANDTSIGVGYAPLSSLERLVLAIEKSINGRDRGQQNPAWGEDVKVMAIRSPERVHITVACAMIGRHLVQMDDYLWEKAAIEELVQRQATAHGFQSVEVGVNTADDLQIGSIYLTVTGTSAEAGDDGQVGRGNRVNGLITPCRPMSLEAAAGKNPVTHVGKIYNVLARQIAEALLKEIPLIAAAQCLLVSRIGTPLTEPALLHLKLKTRDGSPIDPLSSRITEIAAGYLFRIPKLINELVAGAIEIF
jgi:S-adenosylmethionine synthetase